MSLKHTRENDLPRPAQPLAAKQDLAPLLGEWFNANPKSGEITRIVLADDQGKLSLRAFGAGQSGAKDWGETTATAYAGSLHSSEINGLEARYQFGFMETLLALNFSKGVMVIQSYNRFNDGSSRPPYFSREFFHQTRPS